MGRKLYKKDTFLSRENCQIITDSGSGLTNRELGKLDIFSIPINCKVLGEKPKNFNTNEELDQFFSEVKNKRAEKVVTSIDHDKVYKILRAALVNHKFVIFVGTGESLSSINSCVRKSVITMSEKMPNLKAKNRLIVLNTSCVSGGLGFYLYKMVPFIYSGHHTVGEVFAYNQFLANHIVHEFTSKSFDFVEESRHFSELDPSLTKKSLKKIFVSESKKDIPLMYVPRTGKVNATGEIFRGKRALANALTAEFRDSAYSSSGEVWIVYGGSKEDEAFKDARELSRQIKRCCPDAKLDLSHRLTPAVCAHAGDDVVGLIYLSKNVRPDEPIGNDYKRYDAELNEKTKLMKKYITEISRISSLYLKDPNPDLSNL
ncbi:MAG: DegV family protein [Candidatus Saccharibacteria bacterium]|nr:DegV family protein [Candidatus Saccharibacteria bacterium]